MTDISRIVKIWNKSPVPVFNAYSFIFKKIPKIYLRNQKRYQKSPTYVFGRYHTMGSIFPNFD